MRRRWILDPASHNLVPAEEYSRPAVKRANLAMPQVIGDTMNPVASPLTGEFFDSKSALRRTYREAGVTEVGNDTAAMWNRTRAPKDTQALERAVAEGLKAAGLPTC